MDAACSAVAGDGAAFCAGADDGPSPSSSSLEDLALGAASALSALGLSAMLLLQLDGVSRRILSPPRLLAKRRAEYRHAASQSVEYASLLAREHVGGGRRAFDPQSDPGAWENLTRDDPEEMAEIVSAIMDAGRPTPVIVAIERDASDERDPDTVFLFLAFPPSEGGGGGGTVAPGSPRVYPRRVRVPLVAFCDALASAFEDRATGTALCFVADASAGSGTEMLTAVVRQCGHGVATISDPAWMTSLSLLLARKDTGIAPDQAQRVVFALCRLEAWRVRDAVGASRTVLFSLPGQACVPLLLPLVQRAFVHDRHVFVYDGCCYAVETGTAARRARGASYQQRLAREVWEEVSASPAVVTSAVPLAPVRNRDLPKNLAELNGTRASVVEAWMASVDTFLDMKTRERKNFYAPFVCRMGFLMKRTGIGNGMGNDLSELALKNVLQYITGSRSRPLPDEVMARAVACMKEKRAQFENAVKGSELSAKEKIPIEQCVFTHKSILIGEKTLLDTVQPKEDWSLKAAKKLKSCLCCILGEGDEEEEDEDDEDVGNEAKDDPKPEKEVDLSVPGAFATNVARRAKYVDGKTQFAFDPTVFNT